jgi:hypothetical protein
MVAYVPAILRISPRFQHRVAIRLQICSSSLGDEYAGGGADEAGASCGHFSVLGA